MRKPGRGVVENIRMSNRRAGEARGTWECQGGDGGYDRRGLGQGKKGDKPGIGLQLFWWCCVLP